jgi:hypothetical protein
MSLSLQRSGGGALMIIFYSWQSDRPGKTGRHFIRSCLEAAIAELNVEVVTDEASRPDIELDHDTKGIPGSPYLANVILAKIKASSVFIADVTPVGASQDRKPLTNPNVAIELGYALSSVGTERYSWFSTWLTVIVKPCPLI